jgi:phosphoribosylanthranilate isomerase
MIRIKFCGITNLKDAQLGIKLKVDYLGFIVEVKDSLRSLSIEEFQTIVQKLRKESSSTQIVAVMVNPKMKLVEYVIKNKLAHCIQLHGEESAEFCERYKAKIEIWKAFRILPEDFKRMYEVINSYRLCTDRILLDAKHSAFEAFDLYKQLQSQKFKLILAGGLNSKNILNYINILHPEMVDLSGGIEISPGIKSYGKMFEFINIVRNHNLLKIYNEK